MTYTIHCVCVNIHVSQHRYKDVNFHGNLGRTACTRTHTTEEVLMALTTLNVSSQFLTDKNAYFFIHVLLLTCCVLCLRNQCRKIKDRKRETTRQHEHLSQWRKHNGDSSNTFSKIVAFLYQAMVTRWPQSIYYTIYKSAFLFYHASV